MKKISAILFVMILLMASCTKEIKFRGEQTKPRLVVYALARGGEPLQIKVTHSLFFLDSDSGSLPYVKGLDVSQGSVKLYVNDSSTPYILTGCPPELVSIKDSLNRTIFQYYDSDEIEYTATYIPQPGDKLRITASFPDYDEVSCETTVPGNTLFSLNSVTKPSAAVDEGYNYDFFVTLNGNRDADLYYAFNVVIYYKDEDTGDFYADASFNVSTTDAAFNLTQDITSLFADDDMDNVFHASVLPASTYSFKMSCTLPSWAIPDDPADCKLALRLRTIDKSLYYYVTSKSQVGDSSFGIFSEPTQLYSNAVGGYGCFCSETTREIIFE